MNQLAVVDSAEVNSLLAQLNGTQEQDQIRVPFLKIQYEPEDKQDRAVPRGSFVLSEMDEPVYAKSVKIRVLAQHFQYRQTDPETYKIVNKTILMSDMRRGEPRDMKGGLRCGKPTGKALSQMLDEDKKRYDDIKAFRILRGIVTYTGETASGETVTVENAPFQMFLKGLNFMPFEKASATLPRGKRMQEVWFDLTTQKEGKAFIINFSVDYDTPAIIDMDTVDTMKVFVAMAEQENSLIERRYREALMGNSTDDSAYDEASDYLRDGLGDLEEDFQ